MTKLKLKQSTDKKLSAGRHYPLGATACEGGVNFAIYSKHAKEVYLILFDKPYGPPTDVIRMRDVTKHIWHTFVFGVRPGQSYGYRVRGDYDPANGLRFNENKLLIDPYAKALSWKARNKNNLLLSYKALSKPKDLSFDPRDNFDIVPKSIVIDDTFDWQGDKPPDIPLDRSIIYEVHLKGFTAHYRSSKVYNPGTYLGFIEKIPHLKKLGITAVEFLPLQEFYNEDFLLEKGLKNYWGYNTIGFFAPESSYSTSSILGSQVTEFKTMVRELHRAGIEVIMDVVYNHTAEGNEMGPTLSFRGIDNPTYYSLKGPEDEPKRFYVNHSGCGNCINASDPYVIRFILDSLRYWVEVMHVDGFRFDLASVLGREDGQFDSSSAFFDVVSQDPALNKVKLIAEPWDMETYQAGNFPVDWSELNGMFRDTLRRFGKGDGAQVDDLKLRLCGSPDLYGNNGRTVSNSINFVTNHDGFTLNDLVSYNHKHNGLNLEDDKDGMDDNFSWNCGVEGETDDDEVLGLRRRLAKNYICCLFLSAGTPLMLGGDEFLRTQRGNNNTYCQDNELSWFDWSDAKRNADFMRFCVKVIAFVKKNALLRIRQCSPENPYGDKVLTARLSGKNNFFIVFNNEHTAQTIDLPAPAEGRG
jgi:glycogen operon protein